ncbi:C-type lectin domain family 17, member A-like isoform X2 [Cloeon dipterum]|uniref:C-type lectin domain family 17, member A-like isoform X2 n=1 Tax=Cloeon dipterum TaxID=197152 RepID=UPI00321F7A54
MHSLSLYLFLLVGISAVLAAPAEETTTAQPKCPPSSIETHLLSNGKKYFFHEDWSNFDKAKNFCQRNNGRLPILDTREDLDVVREKAGKISGVAWWVDASDEGQEPGQYRWANGKELPLNSSLWFKQGKQPNSFGPGQRTCVAFSTWYGNLLWDDSCGKSKFVVCQANDGC